MLPISIGALTTIAAFLVMTASPMHGYQQLGIFGAIGVVVSAAFALVILPLLVPMAKTPAPAAAVADAVDGKISRRSIALAARAAARPRW